MMVKIFRCFMLKDLEDEVNNWLSKGENEIFKILQSEDNDWITISIFYRKAE